MQGKSLNDVAAEFAKEETASFKEIRQMFLEALDEVAEGTVGKETKNTAEGGVKMSYAGVKDKKITPDMSEKDRAEILKNTDLKIVKYEGNEELSGKSVIKLKSSYNSEASRILKELGEKFSVFKGLTKFL